MAESPQVDNAAEPASASRLGKRSSRLLVLLNEPSPRLHGVNQVVGDADVLQGCIERGGISHVAGHDLGRWCRAGAERFRAAGQAPHPSSLLFEGLEQFSPNVTGSARKQYQ
jgi:hypothetical protein